MAESARQEIIVPILGKTFTARPTWKTLSAIESALGMSAYSVGMRMMSIRSIGIGEMAIVLQAVIASDETLGTKENPIPSVDQIGDYLFENGYRQYLTVGEGEAEEAGPISLLLTSALKGHKVHLKEVAAAKGEGAPDPSTGG